MKNIILIIVIAMTAISCSEKINLKLDDSAQKIVIEGLITNETKAHTIKITKSTSYFSDEPAPAVTGANVTINDGTLIYHLNETSAGIYQTDSNFAGVVGKTYVLNISYNGESYSASSLLKFVPQIDSITCKLFDSPFGHEQNIYEVDLWAQEPEPSGDYYLWNVYKNNVLYSDTLNKVAYSDDSFINGNYAAGIMILQVKAFPGDTVMLEMLSISKEYFNFLNDVLTESSGGSNPFSGPPANVKGNISNGALGFFLAAAVSSKSCIIK